MPDGALKGGRERLGALPWVQETSPQPLAPGAAPWHLDAIALPHAGAQGVQASGQVGRAAALAEVVGDAAGEAQGGESATQTCGGSGRSGSPSPHLLPGPWSQVEGPRRN